MAQALDYDLMKNRMKYVYKLFLCSVLKSKNDKRIILKNSISKITKYLSKHSFEGPIQEGFDIFALFATLRDASAFARNNLLQEKFSEEESRSFEFFKQHTGRIEVVIDNRL